MKIQKIISIVTIVISLSFIIYMCVMMGKGTGNNSSSGTATPGPVLFSTPGTTTNTSTPLQNTPSPVIQPSPTIAVTPTAVPSQSPVTAVPGGKISTNPNYAGKKIVSITFDDGPHGSYTPKILDMLKEKDIDVTFFIIGENLYSASQKNIIKRALDEGHELANHSYDHPNFKSLSAEEIADQLQRTDNLIKEATGITPILFRPPYGSYNQFVSQQSGKAIILWNIDSRDWDHISAKNVKNYAESNNISIDEAKDILINEVLFEGFTYTSNGKEYTNPSIVSQLRHGSIILFHDIHPYSGEAVSKLIDYIKQSGEYEILTVSEMIETEQASPKAGDVYAYMWEAYATQKQNW